MKKYGVKYRTLFNRKTDEIMEFDNRKDALKQAKETYIRLEDKGVDWIR